MCLLSITCKLLSVTTAFPNSDTIVTPSPKISAGLFFSLLLSCSLSWSGERKHMHFIFKFGYSGPNWVFFNNHFSYSPFSLNVSSIILYCLLYTHIHTHTCTLWSSLNKSNVPQSKIAGKEIDSFPILCWFETIRTLFLKSQCWGNYIHTSKGGPLTGV